MMRSFRVLVRLWSGILEPLAIYADMHLTSVPPGSAAAGLFVS